MLKSFPINFFIKWWFVFSYDNITNAISQAKIQIANHPQFLCQKTQIQAKLAAAKSRDDYKKELLEVLSQLSEEDTVTDSEIPTNYDAQDPYDGYNLELSSEDIEAIQRSLE